LLSDLWGTLDVSSTSADSQPERSRLHRLGRLAGYGVGDYGLNIYWNTLSLFLVYWYTTVVGLPPEVAGALYFIGMMWDALSDPVVANLAERVRTKHGTYRPFLLFGSGLLGLLFIVLFWVPPFGGTTLLVYLAFAGVLFRTGYTLVAIPYAALSARLTFDSVERTELAGVRMFFASGGLLTVSLMLPPLLRYFSGGSSYTPGAFQLSAALGGLCATLALLLCFKLTTEQSLPAGTKTFQLKLGQILRMLMGNKALLVLLAVIFLQSSGSASLMVSLLFFLETQDGLASQERVLTCFALSTMFCIPIWTLLIRQIGKKRSWLIAAGLMVSVGLVLLLKGPVAWGGIPLPIMGYAACLGAFAVMLWSFVPDTVEFGQESMGLRAEGVSFGAVMVAQKTAGASMGLLVGVVLSKVGFSPDQVEQSASTSEGLVTFLAIAPGALFLLSAWPVQFLPLDRHSHAARVSALKHQGDEGRRST